MCGKYWSLANTYKQRGQLDSIQDFVDSNDDAIFCCTVNVPITTDIETASFAANMAGCSSIISSFELWCNGGQKEFDIAITSTCTQDIQLILKLIILYAVNDHPDLFERKPNLLHEFQRIIRQTMELD